MEGGRKGSATGAAGGGLQDGRSTYKLVVVGDGAVGKTCLLLAYAGKEFTNRYVPTVFDNFTADCAVSGRGGVLRGVRLSLWDTAGQEDYDRIRVMTYSETDLFLVCFSLADAVTLSNARSRWVPELRELNGPDVRFMLVGLKLDVRDEGPGPDPGGPNSADASQPRARSVSSLPPGSPAGSGRGLFVSYDEGAAVADELGALLYMECSAATGVGVKAVLDEAVHLVENSTPKAIAAAPAAPAASAGGEERAASGAVNTSADNVKKKKGSCCVLQ
jgi:Ras-related C3 botulinum toxin substrate 1